MPIYDFECKDCNQNFEALVSLSKEKEVVCPNCNGKNLKKLPSLFGTKKLNDCSNIDICQPKNSSCCGGSACCCNHK
ncbi:MAG: zinc ribbon domain-containing protein [Opitutales bacterium]